MYITLLFKVLKLSTEGNFSKAIGAVYRMIYACMHITQGATPSSENKMCKVFTTC